MAMAFLWDEYTIVGYSEGLQLTNVGATAAAQWRERREWDSWGQWLILEGPCAIAYVEVCLYCSLTQLHSFLTTRINWETVLQTQWIDHITLSPRRRPFFLSKPVINSGTSKAFIQRGLFGCCLNQF